MPEETNNEEQENLEQQQEEKEPQEEEKEYECESCEDFKQKWLRAQADYQNLKKEVSEKRKDWKQRTKFKILEDFIPVFDNFKKAYEHKPEKENEDLSEWRNWAKGMEFILKKFDGILKDHGVGVIKAEGKEFNPNLHDAVQREFSDEYEEDMVIREMERGYKTDEKVLKPARVVVSKGSKENEDEE